MAASAESGALAPGCGAEPELDVFFSQTLSSVISCGFLERGIRGREQSMCRYLLVEGAREHPAPLLHPGEMLVRLLHLGVDGVQVALHPVQLLPLLVQHCQGVLTRVLCLCVGGLWSNCCDATTIVTSSSMLSMFRVEARELSVVAFALAWYLSRSLISAILSSKENDSLILYSYSKHSPDFIVTLCSLFSAIQEQACGFNFHEY